MKIFKNVLSEDTYNECLECIIGNIHETVWGSSYLAWSGNIREGVLGNCSYTAIPERTRNHVLKDARKYLPTTKNYVTMFYAWQPLSAISPHDDHQYNFGATIYLNRVWEKSAGGIFMWEDKKNPGLMKALCPQRNVMVPNDKKEEHFISQVSPYTPEPRFTIQIWGYDKESQPYRG